MSNSTGMYGSLCLEDIFEGLIQRAQDGSQWVNINACLNPPFNVSQKNGKHYVNIVEWIHPEPDQHGQNAGIHLSMEKGAKERGEKPRYIGNMRYMQQQQPQGPPAYQQPPNQWQQPGAGSFVPPFQQPQQRPPAGPPPQYQQSNPYQQPPSGPPQYPGPGPQPVTQQMIHNANQQQPQGPPQFGPPQQGAWTPAVGEPGGPLPF